MSGKQTTLGADPEVFLVDQNTGKYVPACGLIGGTKDSPKRLRKELAKGFTIQEDNVMVEFNVPPSRSLDQWLTTIETALTEVKKYVQNIGPYNLAFVSQAKFGAKLLDSDQARLFGCSPDFNAYEQGAEWDRISPKEFQEKDGSAWRFAGGHVHVGFSVDDIPPFVAATFADLYIGLATVGGDDQDKRRAYYGQPGRFRPTPYGIEYRTPSNFWLRDQSWMLAIGNGGLALGSFLMNSSTSDIRNAYQKIPWGVVRDAVAKSDVGLAMSLKSYIVNESLVPQW